MRAKYSRSPAMDQTSECNVFRGQCVEGPNIEVNIFTYGFNLMFGFSMAVGVTVAFSQQSFFVDICIQQSNFSAVDFDQENDENGLLLLYVFRELMSKVTIFNECIFKGLALDVQFYFRTDFVNLKNVAGCSSATVCATEIKNSLFQDTIIDIYIPLTQQDLTNNYNLPKVSLNDDRILNSAVITNAESGRGNFIVEMNNVQFLCSKYTCSTLSILVIALASFSISSSSESQSHFELAAISVIDTDVHLSGNLSFKSSSLSLEGNSHLVLQEPLSAIFVGKQLASKPRLSVVYSYLYKFPVMCPIQFSTQHVYTPDNITDIDIHLTFINCRKPTSESPSVGI